MKQTHEKKPSEERMNELIRHDSKVVATKFADAVRTASSDLGLASESTKLSIDKLQSDFKALDLTMGPRGKPEHSASNCKTLIWNEMSGVGGIYFYNESADKIMIRVSGELVPLEDHHVTEIATYISSVFHVEFEPQTILRQIESCARKHRYNPFKEYLEGLVWDGVHRVETLLSYYLGADDNELNRAVIRKFLCAVVARTYRPGTKFDFVPLLFGPEGMGKSSLWVKLLPSPVMFTDNIPSLNATSKEFYESVRGKVIVEIAEMMVIVSAKHQEAGKSLISRTTDTCRQPYARLPEDHLRRFCFVATTNDSTVLKGNFGNRRFWAVEVRPILEGKRRVFEELPLERDQIWAEAVHIYRQGEDLYLSDVLELQMRTRQMDHNEVMDSILLDQLRRLGSLKVPANIQKLPLAQAVRCLKGETIIGASSEEILMPPLGFTQIVAFLDLKETPGLKKRIKAHLDALGCGEPVRARWENRTTYCFKLPSGDDEADLE